MPSKIKPMSKADLFYVRAHMDTLTVEEIAKDLGQSILKVRLRIEKYRKEEAKTVTAPAAPEPPPRPKTSPLRPAPAPVPAPPSRDPVRPQPPKQTPIPRTPPPQQQPSPKAVQTLARLTAHPSGAVVMTPQQSMQDDADLGASPFGGVAMTEAQKVYIRSKKDELTVEQIAKDVGLMPFEVRQYIESLDPANQGRTNFFDRNKKSIHKIREDQPIR